MQLSLILFSLAEKVTWAAQFGQMSSNGTSLRRKEEGGMRLPAHSALAAAKIPVAADFAGRHSNSPQASSKTLVAAR